MATFEEQLGKLESVVERLERGELSLEESVRLFEEGVGLSNVCKEELDRAEGRIEVLVRGRNGLITEPLDPKESLDAEDTSFSPDVLSDEG